MRVEMVDAHGTMKKINYETFHMNNEGSYPLTTSSSDEPSFYVQDAMADVAGAPPEYECDDSPLPYPMWYVRTLLDCHLPKLEREVSPKISLLH